MEQEKEKGAFLDKSDLYSGATYSAENTTSVTMKISPKRMNW